MNYYQSPRVSYEVADCAMPITFDTYSNCAFSCAYCFSAHQRNIGDSKKANYAKKKYKSVNPDAVKKLFLNPDDSVLGTYIKQKKVMQWGGLSDQFDYVEKKEGITLELLRFFREIEYPISFSTKSTWWLDDSRYTELFKDNKLWHTKISIITLDEKKAAHVEKAVASPKERLEAMAKLAKLNTAGVTLRLRPFIIYWC